MSNKTATRQSLLTVFQVSYKCMETNLLITSWHHLEVLCGAISGKNPGSVAVCEEGHHEISLGKDVEEIENWLVFTIKEEKSRLFLFNKTKFGSKNRSRSMVVYKILTTIYQLLVYLH